MSIPGVIALNRFGLGGRPGELPQVAGDPRAWLLQQIRPDLPLPEAMRELPDSGEARALFRMARRERQNARNNVTPASAGSSDNTSFRRLAIREVGAKLAAGIATDTPLYERLVMFWANHFTVSARKGRAAPLVAGYEREAIRPHVFGRFRDLLRAAALHPAMLLYLDNQLSVGPNSPSVRRLQEADEHPAEMGRAGEEKGFNENLAREVMELHTLGVNGGYTQADVTNFAKVLTGWGVRAPEAGGGAMFFAERHEPGRQVVLGRAFADTGEEQAIAVLDYLAGQPATARFLAGKLARHFVSDEPPAAAVDAVAEAFLKTDGDLAEVSRALVRLDAAWQHPFPKFKRPDEYLISVGRAMNDPGIAEQNVIPVLTSLGMRPFSAASPQGWPDTAPEWAGADAVWKRIEWANLYATRRGRGGDARELLASLFGDAASDKTRAVVAAADSPAQALTLLFTSPEFMRR